MRKNIASALIIFLFALLPILAHAENQSNIGVPPDSPFYFLQNASERIKLIFTFDSLEKTRYQLQLIERRAEEIRYLAEKSRLTIEKAIGLQKKTEALIENARERLNQAVTSGRDARGLIEKMQTILERQQQVLENVSLKVPDEAKDVIQKAIEVSRQGKERALEILNRLQTSPPPSSKNTPKILNLGPRRGSIDTNITVTGSGFTPNKNSVHFGEGFLFINDIDSPDGETLAFTIPDIFDDCNPEGTICAGLASRIMPDTYNITVINANGTSNGVNLTVTAEPSRTPTPQPRVCTQEAKICPDGSAVGRTGPNCEFAPCPAERRPSPTPRPSPMPSPSLAPSPTPSPTPSPISFIIEADDSGLYPSTIRVPAGKTVTLTFKVRSANVYFGGLDFRSTKFNVPRIPPGGTNSVSFVTDETFTYSSYWPASGVKKADGTVIVE